MLLHPPALLCTHERALTSKHHRWHLAGNRVLVSAFAAQVGGHGVVPMLGVSEKELSAAGF